MDTENLFCLSWNELIFNYVTLEVNKQQYNH